MDSAVAFLSTPSPCQYLPDRIWQLRYELVPDLRPADYMQRLQQGWRRFGWAMFRPECPSCRMCQALRVPVATFRPNSSQRRTWNRNQAELAVRIGAPSLSRHRLDLWARFHRHGHETKGWPLGPASDPGMLLENSFRTEE
jgi:leucyl-tRNA---protein transferase